MTDASAGQAVRRRLRPASRPAGRDRGMGYAYGVQAGNLVFVSGQLATDASGALVGDGDVEAQAMKAFENVEAVIAEAGGTRADIVKVTVYLPQSSYLEAMQRARRRFFTDPDYPASTASSTRCTPRSRHPVSIACASLANAPRGTRSRARVTAWCSPSVT